MHLTLFNPVHFRMQPEFISQPVKLMKWEFEMIKHYNYVHDPIRID